MPPARARATEPPAAAGTTKKPRSAAAPGPATVHPSMPGVPLGPSGPASWEDSLAAAREGPPVGRNELKLLTWNVASLRACVNSAERKSSLQAYIAAENPGVLALQETKLQESHVPEFADLFPGYTWYATCSTEKKGYSGVGMFVRSDLEVVSHCAGMGAAEHDHEGRVYTVQLARCTIVNVYVPNAGDGLKRLAYRAEDWDVAFREYVGKLSAGSPTIVVGDMNVAHQDEDVYNPKGFKNKVAGFTDAERANFTRLLESGFTDMYKQQHPTGTQFTFWSYRGGMRAKNRGWRLDYILADAAAAPAVVHTFARPTVPSSDHIPLGAILKM